MIEHELVVEQDEDECVTVTERSQEGVEFNLHICGGNPWMLHIVYPRDNYGLDPACYENDVIEIEEPDIPSMIAALQRLGGAHDPR